MNCKSLTIVRAFAVLLSLFSYPLDSKGKFYHPSKLPLDRWYKDETSLRTYLLSFPRSGNTWTRYCIEWLTKPLH